MKEIKFTILYWVCDSILLQSGSGSCPSSETVIGTVINNGSGSAKAKSYDSGSARLPVTQVR
jgi:hypothetical protein